MERLANVCRGDLFRELPETLKSTPDVPEAATRDNLVQWVVDQGDGGAGPPWIEAWHPGSHRKRHCHDQTYLENSDCRSSERLGRCDSSVERQGHSEFAPRFRYNHGPHVGSGIWK